MEWTNVHTDRRGVNVTVVYVIALTSFMSVRQCYDGAQYESENA